jgi:leader peptidase (prepilin peptidase)/N-methyltransferase
MMDWAAVTVLAFVFGLLFGSFLNVCVHRWPRDESVVLPGSHCPVCGHAIRWYDNIPVVSWLLLGARCRDCRTAIPARYTLVELLTGLLFALYVLTWGPTAEAVKWCVFAFLLLGMIFSDLETRLLPDQFTFGGLAAGIAAAAFVPFRGSLLSLLWPDIPLRVVSMAQALLAAAIVSSALWLVGVLYKAVRHKEGLGFGDVKMVAMMAAFLGLSKTLLAVFLGCAAGAVIGLAYIHWTKKEAADYELPFGSFLGAAAILVSFWGEGLLGWYLQQ